VLCDLAIDGPRLASVSRSSLGAVPDGATVVDLAGALVFPGFVDAHVHLDKAHTWVRAPNRTGTFNEAIEALGADKDNWTAADLRRRAGFALRCAWEHGTRLGRIELQTVPLTLITSLTGPGGEALIDLAIRHGACALGGFSRMEPDLPEQLDRLLALARDRGVGVDLHVDENGDPREEVLRAVAEAVLRNQFEFPVVCGHCCSLAVQEPERQRSTIDLVRAAGVRVIALPLCNLYLQDRRGAGFPRTPRWRGLTLVQDLMDAGVPVACASDNVRDAFFAYGDLDATEVYLQAVRLAHLDERLPESVGVVTSAAADLVGRPDLGRIAPGLPAHLVVFPARSFSEFLSRPGSRRRLVDGEVIRESRPPGYDELG
jgi:cytosine deaminase